MAIPLVILFATTASACGSKTGILSVDEGEEIDSSIVDAPPFDAFDTFPCRWSYGQPLLLRRGTGASVWAALDGAVHGRLDTVWVSAEDLTAGDGRVSERLALGDPPRLLGSAPSSISEPSLHGLPDGWTALAPDCSLAFFDDDGRARRFVLPAFAPPPCILHRLDPAFIDLSHGAGVVSLRYTSDATLVHAIESRLSGDPLHAITSPDGHLVAVFSRDPGRMWEVSAVLIDVESGTPVTAPIAIGTSPAGLSTGVDSLRPAALALLSDGSSTTLIRLRFDPADFMPQVFATTVGGAIDPNHALSTNETEALMALDDGSIAIQPLSGSAMRALEPPEEARIEALRVILAPGQSRGGVLYSHTGPAGSSDLVFRTLVCNR